MIYQVKARSLERMFIGNAVPPQAALAIACTFLRTLLAQHFETFLMSSENIWVHPLEEKSEPKLVVN